MKFGLFVLTFSISLALENQALAFVLSSSSTINGSGNGVDSGYRVATDNAGNVYVTGDVWEAGNQNIWIAKYNSSLVLQASTTINGPSNSTDFGSGITTDSDGNIYVTGLISETVGDANIWIAKYNPSLALQSSATINGSANVIDTGYGIIADNSGNIYVTGRVNGTLWADIMWIAKYNSSLVLQSSRTVDVSGNGSDVGHGITVDNDGNIYIIGWVQWISEESGSIDIHIAKYNSFLVLQASATLSKGFSDYGYDIAIDNSGNLYVTGGVRETSGGDNIWIAKYNSSLILQSSATINGSGNSTDEGRGVATDSSGNVYFTGYINESVGASNIWITKYNSSLVLQSSATINGSGNASDVGYDIVTDSSGSIYVTGSVREPNSDIWIAKYLSFQPGTPTLSSATVNLSSITWSWQDVTDETTYRVAYATNPSSYISGPLSANTTTFAETGLSTNTAYSRVVISTNSVGASTSTTKTLYTLAAAPINLASPFSGVFLSSFTFSWDANSNPDGTEYQIQVSTTNNFSGSNDQTLGWSNFSNTRTTSITNLTAGTTYYGQVRARNGDSVPTAYSASVSTTTAQTAATSATPPDLNSVKIFPNPFTPSKGHNQITFANIPPDTKVTIYSLNGAKLRVLTANSAGFVFWDAKNISGENVASGIYLIYLESAGSKRTLKAGVER